MEVDLEPYPVAAEAIDLEVYILAALFAGSERLAEMESEHRGLRWTRSTFEASELSRRLIALAVIVRSQLDVSSRRGGTIVGTLTRDMHDPFEKGHLTLREACNKIIHAETVDLSPGKWEKQEAPSVSTTISLAGTHGDCEWIATFDVLVFLDAVSTVA